MRHGTLGYYMSKNCFQATCSVHADENFTLTRTRSAASSSASRGEAGRPVGLLAAWLSIAEAFEDKDAHKRAVAEFARAESQVFRGEAWADVATLEGGLDVLTAEDTPGAPSLAGPPVVA